MIIPYHEEIVNLSKNIKDCYDYKEKTFVGFLSPKGEMYDALENHLISEFDYALWYGYFTILAFKKNQKDKIEQFKKYKDKHIERFNSGIINKMSLEAMLSLNEYAVKYYENYVFLPEIFYDESIQTFSGLNKIIKDSCDMMTQAFDFDKVERLPKTITTSKTNIYEAFYNYLIMGFTVMQIPKLAYDEKNMFYLKYPLPFIQSQEDKEKEEEVKLTLKHIPASERHKYIKS